MEPSQEVPAAAKLASDDWTACPAPVTDFESVLAAVVAPRAMVPAAWSPTCWALVMSSGAPAFVPLPPVAAGAVPCGAAAVETPLAGGALTPATEKLVISSENGA